MDIRGIALGLGGALLVGIGLVGVVYAVVQVLRRLFHRADATATPVGYPRIVGALLLGLGVIAAGVFLFMVI